jgi:hypothetical protein
MGGNRPFAAACSKDSYAQEANFAKLNCRPLLDI